MMVNNAELPSWGITHVDRSSPAFADESAGAFADYDDFDSFAQPPEGAGGPTPAPVPGSRAGVVIALGIAGLGLYALFSSDDD